MALPRMDADPSARPRRTPRDPLTPDTPVGIARARCGSRGNTPQSWPTTVAPWAS
jgi:hypothetical protein